MVGEAIVLRATETGPPHRPAGVSLQPDQGRIDKPSLCPAIRPRFGLRLPHKRTAAQNAQQPTPAAP